MKYAQKLILPILIVVAVLLVYNVYFSPREGLGSFADFDPNNNAVRDIKVKMVFEKGIQRTPQGGAQFYAADKSNNVILINADKVPDGIESAEIVTLRGHMSQNNSFHAHDVLLE
jgi:cytochrome c-type biogenesis protein CcmE